MNKKGVLGLGMIFTVIVLFSVVLFIVMWKIPCINLPFTEKEFCLISNATKVSFKFWFYVVLWIGAQAGVYLIYFKIIKVLMKFRPRVKPLFDKVRFKIGEFIRS